MTDMKHFRIILDLSAFFYDHRRVARIFVKKNLKSIEDLQNRISEIFQISEFYLITGGHFLPASEDIRVLSNNESICVIPNQPRKITGQSLPTSSLQPKAHKKHKRSLEPILEDSGETSTEKKKKSKKKHYEVTTLSNSITEEEIPRKKKKLESNGSPVPDKTSNCKDHRKKIKHEERSNSKESGDNSCGNEVSQNKMQNQSIVEREIWSLESSQKMIDIKKKLKQKVDEYFKNNSKATSSNLVDTSLNIKTVLPKLQSHIKNCNDLGRSSLPDTVRLSRHMDTPIKTFSRYTPPMRITDNYLAKNKVNIVKIDVVRKQNQDLPKQLNVSQNIPVEASNENTEISQLSQNSDESYSPLKNHVKEVISAFEKNISPGSENHTNEQEINILSEKSVEVKQSGAYNYTKALLDQREPSLVCRTDIAVNLSNTSMDVAPTTNTIMIELEKQENLVSQFSRAESPTSKPLNDVIGSTNLSVDILTNSVDVLDIFPCSSEIFQDSLPNSANTSINLNNPSIKSKRTNTSKIVGGVGSLLGRLRESDPVISQESDGSSQYVTKRKRTRKHRRKSKTSAERQSLTPVNGESYVVKPMNVKACPSIHIKFEDTEMNILEDKSLICIGDVKNEMSDADPEFEDKAQTTTENQSSLIELVLLSDENDDPIMENKAIIGEESILKAPLMETKLQPKVGDVIAFKILKMTEDYNPQVSNYVVGKLEKHLLDTNILYFKILRGEEELLPPSGKFSLKENIDVQNIKYKEFLWTDLISPKLLYP